MLPGPSVYTGLNALAEIRAHYITQRFEVRTALYLTDNIRKSKSVMVVYLYFHLFYYDFCRQRDTMLNLLHLRTKQCIYQLLSKYLNHTALSSQVQFKTIFLEEVNLIFIFSTGERTFSVYSHVNFFSENETMFSFVFQQTQTLNICHIRPFSFWEVFMTFFREKLTLVKLLLLQIVIDSIFRIPKSFGDRAHALFSSKVQ